ncbi:MAG: RsmE family RNA methyltransferase [Oscillospiraceae bacterium]
MPRFFKETIKTNLFIDGADAMHIVKSLRMKVGEALTICDGCGTDYICEIINIQNGRVDLKLLSGSPNSSEPTVSATLFQCLTKNDGMDLIVRDAVQLGITAIVPVLSSRCVSRPDEKSLAKKLARWQTIADESAGQSGRGILPKVQNLISFGDCCAQMKNFDAPLFFYELSGSEMSESINRTTGTAALVIGPEGGFDSSEAEQIIKSGGVATTLGPRILRAVTAPVAAISNLMLLSGNMMPPAD